VRIEIRCKGGRVLKVEVGIDPAVLQALIRSVEAA
jgi:transposase